MVHLQTTLPTVIISYVIIALLLVMVITAYPRFRHLYHNHFEVFHRFFGWTATALVWCQVRNAPHSAHIHHHYYSRLTRDANVSRTAHDQVLLLVNDYRPAGQSLGQAALHSAPFWMILIITVSIILPWIRLRKVEVQSEVLSNHAVLLRLGYGQSDFPLLHDASCSLLHVSSPNQTPTPGLLLLPFSRRSAYDGGLSEWRNETDIFMCLFGFFSHSDAGRGLLHSHVSKSAPRMAHLRHHRRSPRSQRTARVLRHRLPRRRLDFRAHYQSAHTPLDPRTSDVWIHVSRSDVQEGACCGDRLGHRPLYEPFIEEENTLEAALGCAEY